MTAVTLSNVADSYTSLSIGGDVIYCLDGNDDIVAAANDTVYGNAGNDELYADMFGPATLVGGEGRDSLYDGFADDVLLGGAGSDWIDVFSGADTIDGGEGLDVATFEMAGSPVFVDLVAQTFSIGGAPAGRIVNIEAIYGTGDDDTIIGNDVGLIYVPGDGADSIVAGAGVDWIDYLSSMGGVEINLATGVCSGFEAQGDVLSGIEGVYGSMDSDTIIGSAGDDLISGDGGDDFLDGAGGFDWLFYDWTGGGVTVDLSTNTVDTGDTIANFEAVVGSWFDDVLTGDNSDNEFDGEDGADVIDGGGGTDWVLNDYSYAAVAIDLNAGTGTGGTADGDTYFNIENAGGGDFDDTLVGGIGANELLGYAGNDVLAGGAGDNVLGGGIGNDTFLGAAADLAGDTITDFAIGDVLQVAGVDLTSLNGAVASGNISMGGGTLTLSGLDGASGTFAVSYGGGVSTVTLVAHPSGSYGGGGTGGGTIAGIGDTRLDASLSSGITLSAQGDSGLIDAAVLRGMIEALLKAMGLDAGTIASMLSFTEGYVANLASGQQVLLRSVALSGGQETAGAVTLDGSASGQEVIVLDVRGLPSGTVITVNDLDLVVVVGAATLAGGAGGNSVVGDGFTQYVVLGPDDDTLAGGGGADTIGSAAGRDMLSGGGDNDMVFGGEDGDVLYGNAGVDRIYGNSGADLAYGGQDTDWVYGGDGADTLSGDLGDDAVYGNAGGDMLYGDAGNDWLYGGQDTDILFGGAGNDRLDGEKGGDWLAGGVGRDILTGGEGADRFYYASPRGGGDLISDFTSGSDAIAVWSPAFGNLAAGTLDGRYFALAGQETANSRFVFNTATGLLSYDSDGTGPLAACGIATLARGGLSASDIIVLAG